MVTAELDLERNADMPGADLFLDGEELKLFRVYVRNEKGEVVQFQVCYPPTLVYVWHWSAVAPAIFFGAPREPKGTRVVAPFHAKSHRDVDKSAAKWTPRMGLRDLL